VIQRLAVLLVRSAARAVRNTVRYEAPAIGAFIKRQFAPPTARSAAPVAKPKPAPKARPKPATKAAKRPTVDGRLVELEALKRRINATVSLEEYQELYARYRALLAELAAESAHAAATKVKAHTRDGHKVRSHRRSGSKVGSARTGTRGRP